MTATATATVNSKPLRGGLGLFTLGATPSTAMKKTYSSNS